MKKFNNKGFSLIELSIVLIIMGLLVAGITGGSALIKSAQMRSIVTEYNNQRANYNTFYGQNDRVPGSGTDSDSDPDKIETSQNAWDELKTEGMIDKTAVGGFLPSKFKKAYWYLNTQSDTASSFAKTNVMVACGKSTGSETAAVATLFEGKDAQSLLQKMDNGLGNSGSVYAITGDTPLTGAGVETPASDSNYILMMKMDF